MEPTIPNGSYVGIVPYDGNLREGSIYLVNSNFFGRVVKRVKQNEKRELVLLSDNPSYPPQILPYEGYEKVILGRVAWILQQT